MPRNQRPGIAAAAIVVIVVAFLVLRPQDDNSADRTVPSTATTSATGTGHWYIGMIYAAPVLILGAIIGWDTLRHRDEDREDDDVDELNVG